MAKKAASSKETVKSKAAKSPEKTEVKKSSAAKSAKSAAKTPKLKKIAEETVPKKKSAVHAMAEKAKGSKTAMKETKKETKETKKKTADETEKPKAVRASKKTAEPKETKKSAKKTETAAETPKAPEPVKSEVPPKRPIVLTKKYEKEDLEYFRALILDKRAEIVRQIQNLQEQMKDPTTGEYINENSPYSLHMAEQGTDAMEREKTYLYIQRETKFLTYLDDALERIDAGTYGVCIECIDEPKHLCPTCPLISKQRLEAVPHSKLCVEIKKLQEKTRR